MCRIVAMNNFTSDFFVNNRRRLKQLLPGSVVFIAAHSEVQYSADQAFPFRQDSNFWYLTGVNQPDCVLVLDCDSGAATMLLPGQNDYQKEWDGEYQTAEWQKTSAIKNYDSIRNIDKYIKAAAQKDQKIGYLEPSPERIEPYGFYANPARQILKKHLQTRAVDADKLVDVRMELAQLRQHKQPEEIAAIQRAIQVTAKSLASVKKQLKNYSTEKQIERAITSQFYHRGSDGHAYQPIIASGQNASIIHYSRNDHNVENNQLLLLDVGARVDGYAADISRTWAVGRVSKRHKELYQVVVDLQQQAFDLLKPGVILRDYQQKMERKAKDLLKLHGVEIDSYWHGFSHFLGLDVHDAGLYHQPLQPGSVLTVEPGVYLPKEKIGIRVEDNILITENGYKNLSDSIPTML